MSGCGCNGGRCLPREELAVSPAALQVALKSLFDVALTGFKNFPWPNEDIARLAEVIAQLVAENDMLRKLVNRDTKPANVVAGDTFTLSFGPNNAYTLQLPAASEAQRIELARSLIAAAAKLQEPRSAACQALPGQLEFPFTN